MIIKDSICFVCSLIINCGCGNYFGSLGKVNRNIINEYLLKFFDDDQGHISLDFLLVSKYNNLLSNNICHEFSNDFT